MQNKLENVSPQSKSKFYLKLGKESTTVLQAIEFYTLAITALPNLTNYVHRAGAYEENNQFADAIEDISAAIKLDTKKVNESLLLAIRGHLHEKLGHTQLALDDVTQALTLNPSNTSALKVRGLCLLHQNHHDEALASFKKALDSGLEADDVVCYHVAILYARKSDYISSISFLSNAIKLKPMAEYYKKRAANYSALAKTDLALADLNSAIKLAPGDAELYKQLADLYQRNEQYDLASTYYTHAIAVSPTYSEAYFERGNLYKVNKNENALEDFNKAIKYNKDAAHAYLERGIVLFLKEKYQDALNDFYRASDLQPQNAKVFAWRSKLYIELKKLDLAFKDIKQSVLLNNQDTLALLTLRDIYEEKKYFGKILELHLLCQTNKITGFPVLPEPLSALLPAYQKYLMQRERLLADPNTKKRIMRISESNALTQNFNNQLQEIGSNDKINKLENPPSLRALCSHVLKHHSFFKTKFADLEAQELLNDYGIPFEVSEYIKTNKFNEEEVTESSDRENVKVDTKRPKSI